MVIKKFTGKSEGEAVEAAKKELGDGIVIMNVRQVKPGGVFAVFKAKMTEVTVALEEEPVKQVRRNGDQPPEGKRREPRVEEHSLVNTGSNIEKKLDSLQTLLENHLGQGDSQAGSPGNNPADSAGEAADRSAKPEKEGNEAADSEQDKFVRLLYNTMLDNEVDEKYANAILEEVDRGRKPNMPFDYILANVYQKMILKFGMSEGITPAEKGPKIIFFIGPTGVGKTTTIAKLASQYVVEEKKKTALLTADTYRIAAAEQLRTYAGILEIPFRVIYTGDELRAAVNDFKDYDYIFVDTAGHSHRNEEQMDKMQEMLGVLKDTAQVQNFLVLSATTKYRDLKKIADSYKGISDYQLIFTKIDETATLGNLLNLRMYTDALISYITFGQNVPDDIEKFNPQKAVKQILGGKA